MGEKCKMVTKQQVWKGLKLELSLEQLEGIFQAEEYEKDYYYDFDLLKQVVEKAIEKQIDFGYFTSWCVLVANCFDYIKNDNNKLQELYSNIAYYFDGFSFFEEYNQKELLECLANLKYFDYKIRKEKKEIVEPFITNGVERILCFDHCNRNYDSSVYRVILRDYNHKQWQVMFVDGYDFDFDANTNFNIVSEEEFEEEFYRYYEDEEWKEVSFLKF